MPNQAEASQIKYPYDFYIIDINTCTVYGTNDRTIALCSADNEDANVLDIKNCTVMLDSSGTVSPITELPVEYDYNNFYTEDDNSENNTDEVIDVDTELDDASNTLNASNDTVCVNAETE